MRATTVVVRLAPTTNGNHLIGTLNAYHPSALIEVCTTVNPSDPDFPTIVGHQLNQLTVYFYIVLSVGKTP